MRRLRYKILFLASWYPSRLNSVTGIFIKRKAEAVSQLCDVSVIHINNDTNLKLKKYDIQVEKIKNVFTVCILFKSSTVPILKGFIYNIRFIIAHYKAWKIIKVQWGLPDLIHVNVVNRAGYFALFLKWWRGIQYVITEHSTPDIDFLYGKKKKTNISLNVIKRIIFKNSEAVSVDSNASLEYYKKIKMKGNFQVIPNVVDFNFAQHEMKNRNTNEKKIAIHISNLIERKNVSEIILACSNIYNNLKKENFELHIIGDGLNKRNLEYLAKSLNILNSCVHFHGYVDENQKKDFLKNGDFHILNSYEEGFSVVTAEAIAYGMPVIATKSGGPEDFVTKETGILIEPGNIEQLQDAIIYMIDHSSDYNKAKLNKFAYEKFNPTVIAELTYKMYQNSITHWSAGNTRKIININSDWNVLDVGSGHQPNRRANVLLERFLDETIHRTSQNVLIPSDKEFVVGDALQMPFADNSFECIITSHIAEHVDDPIIFCKELIRVANSGYIETPGPLTEYLMPNKAHKWIVYKKGSRLIFRTNKITKSFCAPFFRLFYLNREGYVDKTWHTKNIFWIILNFVVQKIWLITPFAYTRFEWKGTFNCEVK